MKKIGDHALLTMANLTRKGMENVTIVRKDTTELINAQTNVSFQPSSEILEVSRLQVVFPGTGKSKLSKSVDPSKFNVHINVFVPKTDVVAPKPSNKAKDVDSNNSNNINHTLETMHAWDNPHSKNNIDKILSEKHFEK